MDCGLGFRFGDFGLVWVLRRLRVGVMILSGCDAGRLLVFGFWRFGC